MTEGAMRTDLMGWIQRLVGTVFVIGLVALSAAVFMLVRQAEGVPPLPIYAGLIATVALILVAGACMALISIAASARRGANALQVLADRGGAGISTAGPVRPFTPSPMIQEAPQEPEPEPVSAPQRPARPEGKKLVAKR